MTSSPLFMDLLPCHSLLYARFFSLSSDLFFWLSANRLSVNPSKPQLIWFGTKHQLLKLDLCLLLSLYPDFTYTFTVRDLGVTLDGSLSFSEHLLHLTRSCYYNLRCLRAILRSVSASVLTIVHAFICSHNDYCNSLSLYACLPKAFSSSLQWVLNSAARLIARFPCNSHFHFRY